MNDNDYGYDYWYFNCIFLSLSPRLPVLGESVQMISKVLVLANAQRCERRKMPLKRGWKVIKWSRNMQQTAHATLPDDDEKDVQLIQLNRCSTDNRVSRSNTLAIEHWYRCRWVALEQLAFNAIGSARDKWKCLVYFDYHSTLSVCVCIINCVISVFSWIAVNRSTEMRKTRCTVHVDTRRWGHKSHIKCISRVQGTQEYKRDREIQRLEDERERSVYCSVVRKARIERELASMLPSHRARSVRVSEERVGAWVNDSVYLYLSLASCTTFLLPLRSFRTMDHESKFEGVHLDACNP